MAGRRHKQVALVVALYSHLLPSLLISALQLDIKNVMIELPMFKRSALYEESVTNKLLKDILAFMKEETCGGNRCCPFPYINVLQECFYLSYQASTWSKARQHCLGIMGDLAVPKNLFALKDFLTKNYGSLEVFLGGEDANMNGRFVWLDGAPVNASDFAPGEPNHFQNKEFCLGFITTKQPMLIDMVCSNKLRFICQYHFPE